MSNEFDNDFLNELAKLAESYESCMSLWVDEESKSVELLLDRSNVYGDWIPGEGSDICLLRDQETHKVKGVRLPLYNSKLSVSHKGPLRINEGFLKNESTSE